MRELLTGFFLAVFTALFIAAVFGGIYSELQPDHEKCGYVVSDKFVVGDRSGDPHYRVFIAGDVAEVTSEEYAAVKAGDTVCVTWSYGGRFECLRLFRKK